MPLSKQRDREKKRMKNLAERRAVGEMRARAILAEAGIMSPRGTKALDVHLRLHDYLIEQGVSPEHPIAEVWGCIRGLDAKRALEAAGVRL